MKNNSDADEWLMAQAANGNRNSLTQLIRRYASPLLTFIQRMVGNSQRSEELFQEVFLRVWTRRGQYKFPNSFRAWLFAIAANHCRADFRKARLPAVSLHDAGGSLEPEAAGATPVDAAIATETSQLVLEGVQALPHQQRSVVVLRIWNGLSYAEIAEALNCGESTVRSHMHHGLAGLRQYLEPRL